MKKILTNLCGMLLLAAACDSYDDLIPQEYDKILTLKQYGEQEITLYRTGEDTEYEFSIMKTGSVPGKTARLAVKTMDDVEFSDYLYNNGKSYKKLPESCYEIKGGSAVEFAAEETWKIATVAVKFDEAENLVNGEPGNYVIPLLVSSATDSVSGEKNSIVLRIMGALTPKISFGVDAAEITKEGLISIPLQMQIENKWDFTVKVEIADGAAAGAMERVPKAATKVSGVTLENDGIVEFKAGSNGVLNIRADRPEEVDCGTLNLRIVSIEGKDFDYDAGAVALPVAMEKYLQLTVDMLSSNAPASYEDGTPYDGGGFAALLDGDVTTYFHSDWAFGYTADNHYLQVNLPEKISKFAFTYTNRSGNANQALVWFDLYAGTDENSLTLLKSFSWDGDNLPWNVAAGVYVSPTMTTGSPVNVLRIEHTGPTVSSGWRQYFSMSEFGLYVFE